MGAWMVINRYLIVTDEFLHGYPWPPDGYEWVPDGYYWVVVGDQ